MARDYYGSLVNRINERRLLPIPTVGMGATEHLWSDRHAYTVTEVSKETIKHVMQVEGIGEVVREYPKWIRASQDKAVVVSGSVQNGSAIYEFSNDMDTSRGYKYFFHKNTSTYRKEGFIFKDGDYVSTNRTNKQSQSISLGSRSEYYNPSF